MVNLEVVAQDLYILMQKMDQLHKVTMALVQMVVLLLNQETLNTHQAQIKVEIKM